MKLGRFLVLAYLILMPWSVLAFPSLTGHDYARMVQLALMLACSVCLLVARPRTLPWPATAAGRWVAFLMGLQTVVSVCMADRPEWAAREVCMVLGLMGIAWTMASAESFEELRQDAVAVVVAVAFYGALEMSVAALSLVNHLPLRSEEFSMGYSYRRFLNHVQTVALPLVALAASWPGRHALFRAAAWFGLSVGMALLLFTGGRATILAIFSAAIIGHLLLGHRVRGMLLHLAGGAVAGAAIYGLVFIAAPTALGLDAEFQLGQRIQDSGSVASRWVLWELAAAHIAHSPWWGIGPMHFAHYPNNDAAHPHNVYLQIAAEWGIPMLLLVLLACAWGLRLWLRNLRVNNEDRVSLIGGGILFTIIATAFDAFLSGNFVMPVSQVWIATLAGWAIAWSKWAASIPVATRKPPCRGITIGALVILISQLASSALALPEVYNLRAVLDAVDLRVPTNRTNPRFWSHGWF